MKHIIDKSFSFCYGHRVHNQRLDTNFTESGDACLACRHLHGHEGLVKVFLEEEITGKNVQSTGMVTDFKHLGWFKNFVDDTLDHKFIMDIQDPLFEDEFPLVCKDGEIDDFMVIKSSFGYMQPNMVNIQDKIKGGFYTDGSRASAIFEKYEGAVFVDFVPTSENLASWLLEVCQEKMKGLENIKVSAVEYWETPKSHCRVEN